MSAPFEVVIGLEVHAQLATASKLFCACAVSFGAAPNSRTCPICLGLPGTLPWPNEAAVRLATRLALALGARPSPRSTWARKSYFYPDLPKGYQITQHERPLASGGAVRVEPPERPPRWIRLRRLHLEEDAGKSVHAGFGPGVSGVDFNRCGVPLVEIVTEPDLRTPEEAALWLERLRAILRTTGVCEADMERGSLRCDANISLHRPGAAHGDRVEIKNLNSFRHVRRALAFERERQAATLVAGGAVHAETRGWDERAGRTVLLRSKEEERDYRYFDEPDLPPLELTRALLAAAAADLPELPHARLDRFVAALGLPAADAHRLTVEPARADLFEAAVAAGGQPRTVANLALTEVLRLASERGVAVDDVLPAEALGELAGLVDDGTLSATMAREVLATAAVTGASPAGIVREQGLARVADRAALQPVCAAVVREHPRVIATIRAGKTGALGYLVGQVMRRTGGRADPRAVRDILAGLVR